MSTEKSSGKSAFTWISLAVGIAGLAFGLWQSRLAQEANDRAAGRIGAKVEIVRMNPRPEAMAHLMKPVHPKGADKLPHFTHVDELMSQNPGVFVKNTGDENIDGLRIEVQERFMFKVDPSKSDGPMPFFRPIFDATVREDYTLSEKFKPGDTAFIPVGKPLVRSLLSAQDPDDKHLKQSAVFEIRCYGRVAGSPTYERAQKDENIHLHFCWEPEGFSEEKCKRYTEMTHTVKIGPAGNPIGVR